MKKTLVLTALLALATSSHASHNCPKTESQKAWVTCFMSYEFDWSGTWLFGTAEAFSAKGYPCEQDAGYFGN